MPHTCTPPPPPSPPSGCVFAEILLRQPLFEGSSTTHQLQLIVSRLGMPSAEALRANASDHVIAAMAHGQPPAESVGELINWESECRCAADAPLVCVLQGKS